MPDRRRVAVVVTPLLALLAALLVGWSVAAAQAPDPLTLTITAEPRRVHGGDAQPGDVGDQGGTPPYTLTVDGSRWTPTRRARRSPAGTCPRARREAPGTITATVTDATGAPATASAAYTIVPPLPAPTGLTSTGEVRSSHVGLIGMPRRRRHQSPRPANGSAGTGSIPASSATRDAGAEATATATSSSECPSGRRHLVRPGPSTRGGPTTTGEAWACVAAIRHPIEIETPDGAALERAIRCKASRGRPTSSSTATATHDTLDRVAGTASRTRRASGRSARWCRGRGIYQGGSSWTPGSLG